MGNAVIGSLRANLGLDSSKFQKGARGVKDPLKAMKRQFMAVSAVAVGFGGAIVAAAMRGAKQIDDLAKASRRLDASIGGFRAVQLAADEAGISLSSLTNDVQTMNRELSIAGEGGPVDDALKQLGLSAEELLALDVDGRLALIADRIKDLGFSSGKATALLRDFGVRNREMALLMVQGGDAIRAARGDIQDYGLALSEVDSARIEHANDQISRLSIISERFGQRLALVVVPALGKMAEAFTNSMREGGMLRKMIDGFAGNLTRITTYVGTFVTLLGVRLVGAMGLAAIATGGLSAAFITLKGAIMRTGFGALVVGIGEVVYQLGLGDSATSDYQAATEAATTAENNLASAMGGVASQMPGAATQAVNLAIARVNLAKASTAAAQAELQHRIAVKEAAMEEMPNITRMLNGIYDATTNNARSNLDARIADLGDAQKGLDRILNTVINSDYGGGSGGGAPSVIEDTGTELQNLLDKLGQTSQGSQDYEAAVSILNQALIDNKITLEAYGAAVDQARQLYGELEGGAGGAARATSDLTDKLEIVPVVVDEVNTATEGLASTFASTFSDILLGTKSVMGGLAQLAGRLGEMALMKGLEGLFGNLLGGLSGGGAGLASFFGFNANGTEDWQGGLSLVGERGAELVNLPSGSQVFNAQKTAQMMKAPAAAAPEVKFEPKIINLFDMSVVGDWLAGPDGEAAILNIMSRNGVVGG